MVENENDKKPGFLGSRSCGGTSRRLGFRSIASEIEAVQRGNSIGDFYVRAGQMHLPVEIEAGAVGGSNVRLIPAQVEEIFKTVECSGAGISESFKNNPWSAVGMALQRAFNFDDVSLCYFLFPKEKVKIRLRIVEIQSTVAVSSSHD